MEQSGFEKPFRGVSAYVALAHLNAGDLDAATQLVKIVWGDAMKSVGKKIIGWATHFLSLSEEAGLQSQAVSFLRSLENHLTTEEQEKLEQIFSAVLEPEKKETT